MPYYPPAVPVADTTALVKGSADASKLVRLEADGLSSDTTRVLTVQDADGTLACLDVAQTWTQTQTFGTVVSIGSGTTVDLTVSSGTLSINAPVIATAPTLSTHLATKGYVDTAVTGLLDFKGATDASASPNYPAANKGDCYVVSVAGKVGGASGKSVDAGDVYLATADNAGGDEGTVGTIWTVLEHNLVGALLSANNLSDLASASTARTNLGLGTAALKDTGTSGNTVPLLDGANTWSGIQTFASNANIGSGSAAGTLTAVAPGSGAGNGLSLIASAAISGNSAGGDVLLQPGVKSGSGSDGKVIVRQPGGTAGTDEIQMSHSGSYGLINCLDGSLKIHTSGMVSTCNLIFREGSVSSGTAGMIGYEGSGSDIVIGGGATATTSGIASPWFRDGLDNRWRLRNTGLSYGAGAGTDDVGLARAGAGVWKLVNAAGQSGPSTGPGGISSPARSPSSLTADQDNYSPGVGLFQRWSSDASRTVTGLVAGVDGETRCIWNVGSNNIVLANESASSTAANRFTTATGADLTLSANKCALAMYDGTSARWRVALLP